MSVGRAMFTRFLGDPGTPPSPDAHGVHWGDDFASWSSLLEQGRQRAALVEPQSTYVVDLSTGVEAFASLFAVGLVPETLLLVARIDALDVDAHEIAPGLYRLEHDFDIPLTRPLWGVATSGTTGAAKFAVGYADTLELVALHYDRVIYQPLFASSRVDVVATCLPLHFSAVVFMAVLPSLFLCRDLVIYPVHDWGGVHERAQHANVFVLSVPAIAAVAAAATPGGDFSRVAMLLGAGYISPRRARAIRDGFPGVRLANIYGTAETGAISVDDDPGAGTHVGRPIPGKAVWLRDPDERSVGAVAAAGPDCCSYYWRPGEGLERTAEFVANTDFGHFDADGRLYLDGRVDGGAKLFGVLIYPRDIERHLMGLDGVADARVSIAQHPSGREQLLARVVGDVDERDVRAHCASLPESQRPGRIECLSEEAAIDVYSARGKL
jgi:acyl-coenzyme A synthetase/AMP-(fatty) acid ligase